MANPITRSVTGKPPSIFSGDNPKAVKAGAYGWHTAIHYMAPHSAGGVGNLCPHATKGCIELCRGQYSGAVVYYSSVMKSRIRKAQLFMRERRAYVELMGKAIAKERKVALKHGRKLCVRPNGSTDIAWEIVSTFIQDNPDVQFADYTKNVKRMLRMLTDPNWPANYHLCFSYSERNRADCERVLSLGGTVAVVFADGLPATFMGFPVINGDDHDLRHLDPRGVVVGLKPKGHKAPKDRTGFVVRASAYDK